MRQCGPVVTALALRSGDPGFKTRSDHSLNLILVVPASTSQPHLKIANWFASSQLGFLTVVVLFCHFVVFQWPWKAPMGSGQLSMYVCMISILATAAQVFRHFPLPAFFPHAQGQSFCDRETNSHRPAAKTLQLVIALEYRRSRNK